ncbi:MAG: hypothetical protein K2V71_02445 [Methylotenera sp.]|nr:hypothetical protein [Methylotenera sp.]
MQIQTGEIYGKQTTTKLVMYNVVKVIKIKSTNDEVVTLQNIDNPLSLFETTALKLSSSGYIRISQTPFIDLQANTPKRRKAARKATRCPLTFDFLEKRADSEKPVPLLLELFN